ncbi:MAG: Asp-tRNA(Asn)/Glu-tRNA(Gln) amidotransferase subunit GatB [Rhodothermales bacterium]|nr:Asp-tRNA(Asn)/Glu-tRNA(Gln) amidotransferase subunit GatB [Rhodothermales bacterium]
MSTAFEAVIGLEVHCQLLTESKAFSPEKAEFEREPNAQIDFVSLGYPGSLPVLNRRVVEFAVKMGLATNCSIRSRSTLARKHYFYPDLPKGYQITQYEDPICFDGRLQVRDGSTGQARPIRIKRIHMEEDAGKSIHDRSQEYTHLDFNRCGVPLLELVTEPDIRHPSEAYEFVKSIRQIVRYLEVCDGNMEEGSLRCDANISVRPAGSQELRTKTEIKNVNSLRHVEQALEYEINRQVSIYADNGTVDQETLLWDPKTSRTKVMRSKEMAHDYRYFPDPDLPPVVVSDAELESIRASLPELANDRRRRFIETLGLSDYDATNLTEERSVADYFEDVVDAMETPEIVGRAKTCANFILTTVQGTNAADHPEGLRRVMPPRLARLLDMRMDGDLSSSAAVLLYERLIDEDRDVDELAAELSLIQVSDESTLLPMVETVISKYPAQVDQYLGGKVGLIGFFIGQVMKASEGSADPTIVRELVEAQLQRSKP